MGANKAGFVEPIHPFGGIASSKVTSVTQAAGGELRPADDVVGGACAFHIVVSGLDTDAEDFGDLPVGLAGNDKPHAFTFAPASRAPRPRKIVDPPGGPKACTPICSAQ